MPGGAVLDEQSGGHRDVTAGSAEIQRGIAEFVV
jgi:hypothetical protein